ncbi:hypothetical protein [Bradyrhizobium sp. CCBAU 53338]|uniref:hypothetical protein n=1 Tax=Bradyrhizobium sp. CCBAU 53338 TaxID=1325111 RepID=UPI00188ADFB2|nr:hypothetical protein [Bradyrhizobium sp. CCBAU 53338]
MEQLAADRAQKLADEDRKRERDEQRRIDSKRAELQKQESVTRRQLEQAAASQRRANEQLLRGAEQLRQQRNLNAERVRSAAHAPDSCTVKQIQAIANGTDPNKACGLQPAGGAQSPGNTPTPQDKKSNDQLEYLRRNIVRLQPDERKIALPAPSQSNPPNFAVCSTFPGGRCPTADESAAAQAQRAEEERKAAAQRALEEARKNEEARKEWERRQAEQAADANKRKEDAAKNAPITQVEPFEDCGGGLLKTLERSARQAQCAMKGGGTYCTRGTRSRTCTPQYTLGIPTKPKCDDWKIVTQEDFCKADPPMQGPPPKWCDVNKC